ncbi:MAG: hypothetical protein LBI17_03565 [Rickettsiales bacterium]|jgi:hypothetical protein|nr:hypothetical protein [Rickettsiales bacterium]
MKKYQAILTILAAGCGAATAAQTYRLNIPGTRAAAATVPARQGRVSRLVLLEPVQLRKIGDYDFKAGGIKTDAPAPKKPTRTIKKSEDKPVETSVAATAVEPEPIASESVPVPVAYDSADESRKAAQNIEEAQKLLDKADHIIAENKEEAQAPTPQPEPARAEVADIAIRFKPKAEGLTKSDEKKVADLYATLGTSDDATIKIISYYSTAEERNRSFSRLLNTRKALLDRGMPSSRMIIMVLEDETADKSKNNIVEIIATEDR